MLHYTTKQLGNKDVVIVLMHEAKTRTRRILPKLVAFFRERGYEFRKLSAEPEDAEILSRCSANMMLPAAPGIREGTSCDADVRNAERI